MDKKRITKIFTKIDTIAKKGDIGRIEYYRYIDSLLNEGLYSVFQDVLDRKYGIDTINFSTVDEVKRRTFDKIRFQTNSKFQQDLYAICASQSVVQMGQSFSRGIYGIGRIIETESNGVIELTTFSTYNGSTYSGSATASLISKYRDAINFLVSYAP